MRPNWATNRKVSTAGIVLGLLLLPALTPAPQNPNPGVLPANMQVAGKTYAEWGAAWWQWALSTPAATNPILDPDGDNCDVGQSGPVWFLAGTFGGVTTRSCTVPAGKLIFFPIINFIADHPCPGPDFCEGIPLETCLHDLAAFFMDHVTELEVQVDGTSLQSLFDYRATSGLFTFTGDPSMAAVDPCITGTPQAGLSDGFWIMLAPLPAGSHQVRFRGKLVVPDPGGFEFEVDVTYNLLVAA